jgi:antitoxin component of RelBE/YafQ-DinJ toxin-antitoxin module
MAKKTQKTTFTFRVDEKTAGKARGAAKAMGLTIGEILEGAINARLKELEAETGKRFKVLGPRPMKKAA